MEEICDIYTTPSVILQTIISSISSLNISEGTTPLPFSDELDDDLLTTTYAADTGNTTSTSSNIASVQVGLMVSTVMQLLAFPLCLFGNVTIFVAVAKDRKMRKTQSNLYIISLTVADFLVGFVVIPFEAGINIHGLMGSHVLNDLVYCVIHRFLIAFLLGSSLAAMLMISIDRCTAINFPFFYAERVTSKRIKVSILLTWMLMLVLCAPIFIRLLEREHNTGNCTIPCWRELTSQGKVYLVLIYSTLILIFIGNVIFYVWVSKIAIRQHLQIIAEMNQSSNRYLYNRGDIRNTKKMVTMFGVFIIFWSPYMIVLTLYIADVCNSKDHKCTVSRDITLAMGVMNSSINCYIYAWQKRDFKSAIRRMFCSRRGRNRISAMNPVMRVTRPANRNNSAESIFTVSSKLSSRRTELTMLATCHSSGIDIDTDLSAADSHNSRRTADHTSRPS